MHTYKHLNYTSLSTVYVYLNTALYKVLKKKIWSSKWWILCKIIGTTAYKYQYTRRNVTWNKPKMKHIVGKKKFQDSLTFVQVMRYKELVPYSKIFCFATKMTLNLTSKLPMKEGFHLLNCFLKGHLNSSVLMKITW